VILATVSPANTPARKYVSRWLPELASGVYCGEVHRQGRPRFYTGLKQHPSVRVVASTGADVIIQPGNESVTPAEKPR